MAAKGDNVGSASVDIIAKIVVDEESLSAAQAQIAQATAAGTGDAAPRSETRKRGKLTEKVTADVTGIVDKRKLGEDVQSALDGDFRLSIDKASIRAQIEDALSKPFTITVNAEMANAERAAAVGAAHSPVVTTGAPVGRGAMPPEVVKAMTQPLKDAIDNVYRNLNEAYAAAGKGQFGRQGVAPGNQAEKAIELMEKFGGSFGEMLKTTTNKAGVPKLSGPLSPAEVGKALGLPANHPALVALGANVTGFQSQGKDGASPTRGIETLLTRLSKWAADAPLAPQPAAAPQPVAPAATAPSPVMSAASTYEADLRAAQKAVQVERQRALVLKPIDISAFESTGRTVSKTAPRTNIGPVGKGPVTYGPPIPDEPGTDARARRELGLDRANVRRGRGMGDGITFGGRTVLLEKYLRAAEAGQFEGVFERFDKGNASMGLTRMEGGTPESDAELARLLTRKPGVKFGIEGQEGRFARVSPREAVIRQIMKDLGVEEDSASAEQIRAQIMEQGEKISQATQRGASPARGVSGRTKRGQGAAGMTAVGSMRPDPEFDPLTMTAQRTPAQQAAYNARSRQRIDEGAGLSDAERTFRELKSPAVQGQIGKFLLDSLGLEGGATAIPNALMQRYLAETERPEGRTGKQMMRAAAFGPTGRARQNATAEDGVYGELVSAIPADMPRESRKTLTKAIFEMLSSTLEDETFKRDVAETEIARKEGATLRPMRSDGKTGEGLYTKTPPGILGSMRAQLAIEEKLGPGHGTHEGHVEIEDRQGAGEGGPGEPGDASAQPFVIPGLRTQIRLLEERDAIIERDELKARTTRATTIGRGKYQTGDETMDIARASGMAMEGEEDPAKPFAAFSARYGGTGASRGPAASGAAVGAPGGDRDSIVARLAASLNADAVPVRVVNWPDGGTGGGGRGRPPVAEGAPAGPDDEKPRVAKEKRRKNLSARDVGTAVDSGKIYTFEPEGENPPNQQEGFGPGFGGVSAYHAGTADRGGGRKTISSASSALPATEAEKRFLASLDEEIDPKKKAARARQAADEERRQAAEIQREAGLSRTAFASPQALRRSLGLPSAEQRSEADFKLLDESDKRRSELAATARRAERGIPKRGFTASVTDIFANLGGFLDEQVAAVTRYQREGVQLSTLLEKEAKAQLEVSDRSKVNQVAQEQVSRAESGLNLLKQAGGSKREIDLATVSLSNFRKLAVATADSLAEGEENLAAAKAASNQQEKFVAKAAKDLPGAGGKALAFGVGFGAAAGAVAVGQLVSQATQVLIEGITTAVGPVAERLSGFAGTTGRIQGELATDFRSGNDKEGGLLARTGIAARLSDNQLALVGQELSLRAKTVAGTQSIAQQRDLFNAAENIGGGKLEGYDRSLFRSTGGLFDYENRNAALFSDISIGGQASTAETLAGQINDLAGLDPRGGFGGRGTETNKNIFDSVRDITGIGIGDSFETRQAADEAFRNKLLEANTVQLKGMNENLKGSKFRITPGGTDEELRAQEAFFRNAGVGSLGEALKDKRQLVSGIDTTGSPIREVGEFLKTYNEGPKLSPQQLLDLNKSQLKAQIGREDQQRALQLEVINPQQTAISNALNPLAPATAGINMAGTSAADQKRLNGELAQTQKLYNQINQDTERGLGEAVSFVVKNLGGEAAGQFAVSLNKAATYGKEISKLQIGVQTQQANLAAAQYSYQIGIAKRNLQDAKGLTGAIGASNKDNLGVIERQTFLLQRQSQALSMSLSQRQINFSRAQANFQAPGLTSEERAARQEEAKIEADYAQKQLDIQKKLFGLGGKQFDIAAKRQVQDLVGSLKLLEQGRTVTLNTASAEKRIIALTKLQEKENKRIETFYGSAVQRTADVMDLTQQLVAETGSSLAEIGSLVLRQFSVVISGLYKELAGNSNVYTNPNGGTYTGDPKDGGSAQGFMGSYGTVHARGFLGTVSGATSLGKYGVAGEAAGEAVAILKNPQKLVSPMGGEGGGTNITVNVINPVVRKDDDITKIVMDVEKAINRRAALIGLRSLR